MLSLRRTLLALLPAVAITANLVQGQVVSRHMGAVDQNGPTWAQFNETVGRLENEIRILRENQSQQHSQLASSTPRPESEATPASWLSPITRDHSVRQSLDGSNNYVTLTGFSSSNASAWKVAPFGRIRGDFIYSGAPYTNDAVVVFLNPNTPGVDEDSTSVTAKQSQINFAISGPSHNGWDTGGLILINFMGAQPLRNFSGANIVLAYGEFKNEEWRFAFGRMLDLFSPIAPRSVNQIEQRGAGNTGIYRGVLHIDRYVTMSDVHKWTLSSRISQPDISDYAAVPFINGQNNGWPNIEARIGVELGPVCEYGRPIELGVSGVVGELQAVLAPIAGGLILPPADEVEQTRGFCVDAQLRGERLGFRGEAWWGQAAGSYFVASLQSINPETDQAVESVGGWGEVYYKISPRLSTHVGYGVDDPRNSDLGFLDVVDGPGQISYNEVAWWNILYDVTEHFELGFEVSHRRTNFLRSGADNEGTLFHFSSTLNF